MVRLTGYGRPGQSVKDAMAEDAKLFERFANEAPDMFAPRPAKAITELAAWEKMRAAMAAANLSEKSIDLQFTSVPGFNKALVWLEQLIGSCVASGAMRALTMRMLAEVLILGQAELLLGREQVGRNNVAPWAPFHYGRGRQLGGLRGGDGSFCSVQIESLSKYGFLPCSSPKLQALLERRGLSANEHFPEPRGREGMKLYRQCGDGSFLDELQADAVVSLAESRIDPSVEDIIRGMHDFKPCMICSDWAFRPVSQHADGWWIYEKDPNDSWGHNMTLCGHIVDARGEEWIRVLNSWQRDFHKGFPYFTIPRRTMERWAPRAQIGMIGELKLLQAPSPQFFDN